MKKNQSVQYANIPSAIRPLPHGEGLPVPDAPESFSLESEEEDDVDEEERIVVLDYQCQMMQILTNNLPLNHTS